MTLTTFYLMRHGECEQGDLLRGQCDVPLSELGFARMQLTYAKLPESIDRVISSPLVRCRVFAEHLERKKAQGNDALTVCFDKRLQEIYFGDWDGLSIDELYSEHSQILTAYWQNPWHNTLPGGETMAAFETRVDAVMSELIATQGGQTLLILTHGGVIRHLMARALGVTQAVGFYTQLSLDYASVVKITHYRDEDDNSHWRLHWCNDSQNLA